MFLHFHLDFQMASAAKAPKEIQNHLAEWKCNLYWFKRIYEDMDLMYTE